MHTDKTPTDTDSSASAMCELFSQTITQKALMSRETDYDAVRAEAESISAEAERGDDLVEIVRRHAEFSDRFPSLFAMITRKEHQPWDRSVLKRIVGLLKGVQAGRTTEHAASVSFGQAMLDKFAP